MSDTPPQKIWIDTEIYENRWHDHDVGEIMDCFGPYHHDDTVQELVKALLAPPDPKDTDLLRGRNLYEYEQTYSRWRSTVVAALAPFQQEDGK